MILAIVYESLSILTSESSSRVDVEQASTKWVALFNQTSKTVEYKDSNFSLIKSNISFPKEYTSAEV